MRKDGAKHAFVSENVDEKVRQGVDGGQVVSFNGCIDHDEVWDWWM